MDEAKTVGPRNPNAAQLISYRSQPRGGPSDPVPISEGVALGTRKNCPRHALSKGNGYLKGRAQPGPGWKGCLPMLQLGPVLCSQEQEYRASQARETTGTIRGYRAQRERIMLATVEP